MPDSEKIKVAQKITAKNGGHIENVAQIGVQNVDSQRVNFQKVEVQNIYSPDVSHSRIPFQVPSLTEDFVTPPKKEEIKNRLLNCNNTRGILAITAIQGLGGIGKTTLAKIIANDKEIQIYFSDGILWVTLGQEPEKLSLLNGWIQNLGDAQIIHTTIQSASNHLRTLLQGKRILLIVDDVWEYGDVEPFRIGGSNCQTIITTRKAYIADELGAKSYPLNVMTEEQSLELFKNILKDCWHENEKEDALKVAKDVGCLPLALNLAAKKRKRNYSWVELHKALEEEIAHLSVLESPRRLRKGEEHLEASLSLKASLNLSLRDLRSYDEEAYEYFVWLGILPEDVKINEIMASTLWDIDKKEAEEILEALWEEGLLTQDLEIQFESENLKTYRMHDLFHDIARYYLTLSPVTKKAIDIPGLGLKLCEAHTSLLNRYQSQTQKKGLWHTLIDDAYIHSHLTWHMEKAGQIEEIHKLLSEENENGKNGWYESLESLGQNAVFIEDIIGAWNLCERESIHQIEQGGKASSIGLETRYALIYASINSLSANIPEELLIAFLETKKWTEAQVFTYAQKEPHPYKRAIKLISIHQNINGKYIKKEEVLEKVLDAASWIKDDYKKGSVLSSIVPYLDGQIKEEAIEKTLNAVSIIENNYRRESVLSSIVPYFDGRKKEEMMEKAIDTAYKFEDNVYKVKALSAMIPYLDGQKKEKVIEKIEKVVEEALDAAFQFKNDDHLIVMALSAIIPYLDDQKKEEVIEKALDVIFRIKYNDRFIIGSFLTIIPYLDGQEKEKVIEEAIDEASGLVVPLLAIVPYLDGQKKEEVIKKALDVAYKIEDDDGDNSKVEYLLAIVPYLEGQTKEEVIDKALDLISKIRDDNDDYPRAKVLSSIVPYLDGQKKEEVMERALDVAYKIEDNDARVRTLSAITPYFDGQKKEEMIEKALDMALKIENRDYKKVLALSFIIPHLDSQKKEEIIEKALDAAYKIIDSNVRFRAFSVIVPYLDSQKKEEMIEEVLDGAYKIEDNDAREKTLLTIVPIWIAKKEKK